MSKDTIGIRCYYLHAKLHFGKNVRKLRERAAAVVATDTTTNTSSLPATYDTHLIRNDTINIVVNTVVDDAVVATTTIYREGVVIFHFIRF